jgi:hypothetical protein
MIAWFQDLSYALRQLRKSPGFTITAVLTLAMAIGANAVVFGVMNGLVLRPLNVPQAESLYTIERASDKDMSQSYPDYLDLRLRNRSFEDLAAYSIPQVGLDSGEGPIPTWGVEATGNYFDALGIRPYLGRFFHGSDEHGPNSAPYLVLSYAYWHSHFHDDHGVLGRVVQVNKHPFTILGVAPPDFRGTLVFYSPNFFVPLTNKEQVDGSTRPERSRKPRASSGDGPSQARRHSRAGDRRFELGWLLARKSLSERRARHELRRGPARLSRRSVRIARSKHSLPD